MKLQSFLFISFILLLSAHTNTVQAQVNFYYGPRVGLGFNTFFGKDAADVNYPLGTIIGVYTQTALSNRISIDAELLYLSMGSRVATNKYTPEQKEYKISLGYIAIPLNVNYRLYKGLNVQAGVQIGYLLTALTQQKYQEVITKDKTTDRYYRFDVCPTIGMFYQLEQGLQFGVRYYAGIQSIFKVQHDIHNTGLQFLLTYRFSSKNP